MFGLTRWLNSRNFILICEFTKLDALIINQTFFSLFTVYSIVFRYIFGR